MPNALYRNKNTNWDNGREYDVSTGDYTGVVDQLYRPSTVKDNFYKNNGVKAPVGGALVQNEYGSGITQDGINFISQDGTTPIMPSALTSEKPLTMPTTPPVSTTVDTTAQAAATSAQTATDAQIASNASKQELKSEGQGIMDIVNNIANQPTKQQAQYEEQGLLEKKAEIDRISLEMSQANQRAQKEIDTIQAQNPGGLIGSGASTRIRQIQRENAAYQADRAFGLAALQGNYTAAKDAIDAKIEAETSGMKLQLEAKKYFYEQNREDFTKEEQRAYEEILRKEEITLVNEKTDKDAKRNLAISYLGAGGSSSTAQAIVNAGSFDEAVSLTGGVLGAKAVAENAKLLAEAQNKKPITGEWSALINGATGFVPGTMKDSVRNNIAQAISNEDYPTAIAEVENAVENGLIGDGRVKYSNARTDSVLLKNLKSTIQKYAEEGGDMNLLKGKEEEIKRKLGIDSGSASVMAVQLWREFQSYRNNITGAAFSEKESRDYASVNPTLGKTLDLNLSIIDGAINQLDNRVKSTVLSRLPSANTLYGTLSSSLESKQTAKELIDAYVRENPLEAAKVSQLYTSGKWSDDDIAEYLNLNN